MGTLKEQNVGKSNFGQNFEQIKSDTKKNVIFIHTEICCMIGLCIYLLEFKAVLESRLMYCCVVYSCSFIRFSVSKVLQIDQSINQSVP